jgi:hypothetical protein
MWIRAIGIAGLTLIGSCQVGAGPGVEGKSVQEAYDGEVVRTITLQDAASPLSQEKRIPVISAPEVFAVYVPSHVDVERDMLVGEHWLFVKLRDSTWFTDRMNEPGPEAKGVESLEDVRTLAPAVHGLGQIVVPYGK